MIRLFTQHPLSVNAQVLLTTSQANYLHNVMRQTTGQTLLVFNGVDGEWLVRITTLNKKTGVLTCETQQKPQSAPTDIHLVFAPLKKTRTDFLVEKACEMGCAQITPVFTAHTNAGRINTDRLHALMIEAAEQCGITHVPAIQQPTTLDKLCHNWNPARSLLFCNERQTGTAIQTVLQQASHVDTSSWAILIGPEGGFSDDEIQLLERLPFGVPVTLGPRILRAETAAIAALTAFQIIKGDWVS